MNTVCKIWEESQDKNPITDRSIKKHGETYNFFNNFCPNSKNFCEIWAKNKNINPLTNNYIVTDGLIYNRLKSICENNINSPEFKTELIKIFREARNIDDTISEFNKISRKRMVKFYHRYKKFINKYKELKQFKQNPEFIEGIITLPSYESGDAECYEDYEAGISEAMFVFYEALRKYFPRMSLNDI